MVETVAGPLSSSLSLLLSPPRLELVAVVHPITRTADTGLVTVVEAMAGSSDEGVAVARVVAFVSERELAPLNCCLLVHVWMHRRLEQQ